MPDPKHGQQENIGGIKWVSDLSRVLLERRKLFKCCLDIVFSKHLGLRYLLVNFFSVILLGLEKLSIRHGAIYVALMLSQDEMSCRSTLRVMEQPVLMNRRIVSGLPSSAKPIEVFEARQL